MGRISLPEIREAFLAGVNYVNEELGGINGRPMKADTCNLDVTPESSVNCANKFVEDNVVVAVQGVDVAADAALPIWKQAGLVDIAFAGFTPTLNQSRGDAFVTLFDSRDILAQNLIMQQKLGAKSVAIVQQDLPSTKAYFDSVEKPTADKLGLKLQPFYYDNNTDWTTLAATILSSNPDGIDFPAATDGCAWRRSRRSASRLHEDAARLIVLGVRRQAAHQPDRGHHQPQRVLLPDDGQHPAQAGERHRHLRALHQA